MTPKQRPHHDLRESGFFREERRNLQKQLNDLSLNHRAAQIELQRKAPPNWRLSKYGSMAWWA